MWLDVGVFFLNMWDVDRIGLGVRICLVWGDCVVLDLEGGEVLGWRDLGISCREVFSESV